MTVHVRPDFDTVVASLYEAAAVSHSWAPAMAALAGLTGSRGALITRPDRKHEGLVCSPGLTDTVTQFFEQGWHHDDLRTERLIAAEPRGFLCDQDITTSEERARSAYYEGFARSAGVPWFAACGLMDGLSSIGVSIQRTAAEGPFEGEDLDRLRRIRPHVNAAMSFARNVADRANTESLDALQAADVAAFIVDQTGVLRGQNAKGEAELSKCVVTQRRRLTARDRGARPALERLIANAAAPGRTPDPGALAPVRLCGPDGSAALANAMPLRGAAQRFGDGRAIVTLTPIAEARGTDAAVLAVAFGLTAAEARVAHHLSRGLEVEEIARACRISAGAVRFHLKAVLPKAGVRRQAAFVAIAAGLRTS